MRNFWSKWQKCQTCAARPPAVHSKQSKLKQAQGLSVVLQAHLQAKGCTYFKHFGGDDVIAAILYSFLGHSSGKNFASIFFKTSGMGESCLLLFAMKNQPDQMVILPIWRTAFFLTNPNYRQNQLLKPGK